MGGVGWGRKGWYLYLKRLYADNMPLNILDLALIGGMFAAILTVFAAGLFGYVHGKVQKWIGASIGRFMQNLAKQAAEEEGAGSSPGSGVLNLGGLKIDPQLIQLAVQYGPKLLELAKQFGLLKGGGETAGAGW